MTDKNALKPFFDEINRKSDKVVEVLLIIYFVLGIGISFFYDTYLIGIGVGTLSLILYFTSKHFFKHTTLNQYIASLVAGIFMAQFIYQMHGLFEMHFTAFVAIIALIAYQNKYAFLPQLLFVLVHHSAFAYIQYRGVIDQNESYQQIYFTQLEYMDLQTFFFHAGLYALGIAIAAIYAHNLRTITLKNARGILKLRQSDERMNKNIAFANSISKGEHMEYEVDQNDIMGAALAEMRDNLQSSRERENREKFANVGIAEISEIIRNNSGRLEEMCDQIISYLVKYLKSNQGGIFVLNEQGTDKYLELLGCYAYNRKRFLNKKVQIGQGLVGQCFLERDVIHMTEIPDDYVNITSGLGEATPNSLLLVPIKNDQMLEGVMELASFKGFEDYEIDFLKKVGQNIAANISAAKVNARTKILFEESKEQAEEMKAQEEEMRQNMEELAATQEEMERQGRETFSRINAINDSGIGSIEFTLDGIIVNANEAFCEVMKYSLDEIKGQHHRIFVDPQYAKSPSYADFWNDLKQGIAQKGEYLRYKKDKKPVHLYGAYSIIKDQSENPMSVIKMVVDFSSYMNEIEYLQNALDALSEKDK